MFPILQKAESWRPSTLLKVWLASYPGPGVLRALLKVWLASYPGQVLLRCPSDFPTLPAHSACRSAALSLLWFLGMLLSQDLCTICLPSWTVPDTHTTVSLSSGSLFR